MDGGLCLLEGDRCCWPVRHSRVPFCVSVCTVAPAPSVQAQQNWGGQLFFVSGVAAPKTSTHGDFFLNCCWCGHACALGVEDGSGARPQIVWLNCVAAEWIAVHCQMVFVVVFFGFMIIFGSAGLSTKSGVHANPTCERGNLTVIAAKTCEKRWWCRMNCVEAKEQSVNLRGVLWMRCGVGVRSRRK